jgi:hypothetical protein
MYNIVVLDCDLISTFAIKLIRDIEDKDRTFIIGANDILGGYK